VKRGLIATASTAVGLASVLLVNPTSTQLATVAADGSQQTTQQTFTGSSVATRFGAVQVSATVTNGRLTAVQVLAAPSGDPHSAQISQAVGPQLVEQALRTQSAQIDGVSGATYTSEGFRQSLQAALAEAGL
jgi:uncharacterized protein with FMN-binding domain